VDNLILRALRADDVDGFRTHLTKVSLKQHEILYAPDDLIDYVYFLNGGMVSLLVLTGDGEAIETGIIGMEGVVGSSVCIDSGRSLSQNVVQMSADGWRMPARQFTEAYLANKSLRMLVNKHIGFLYVQAQQNGACHALHTTEARLCRWLLTAQDFVKSESLDLTQEFLSHMLGVQRSSVSIAAHGLQAAGMITYRRGKVLIRDRAALEESACDCYTAIKSQLDDLHATVATIANGSKTARP
jgi:CRP-like cAMP-binding protein